MTGGEYTMAHRILIVEDDRNIRRTMVALFAKRGMVPIEAANVAEAFDRLNRQTTIICLDLNLPDGDGIEVLRYGRSEGLSAKVAVISAAENLLKETAALKPDAIFAK